MFEKNSHALLLNGEIELVVRDSEGRKNKRKVRRRKVERLTSGGERKVRGGDREKVKSNEKRVEAGKGEGSVLSFFFFKILILRGKEEDTARESRANTGVKAIFQKFISRPVTCVKSPFFSPSTGSHHLSLSVSLSLLSVALSLSSKLLSLCNPLSTLAPKEQDPERSHVSLFIK